MEHDEDTKGAIASHSTPTDKGPWDGGTMLKRCKSGDQQPAYFARIFAWRNPDGDPGVKASYKFPHHEVAADGTPGAANVPACQAIIGILNGGRGGASIPDADRRGVWNHAARHLRDAKVEPAPLKDASQLAGTEVKVPTLVRAFEMKAVDEATRSFEGMLAAYSLDQGGDVIVPGAFKRTLRDWNQGKGRIIPLLDSHNRMTVQGVIGKLLDAKEVEGEGLWVKFGMLDAGDAAADAAYTRVKGGYVDGLSIGYRPIVIKTPTDEEARQGIWRFLKELQLKEGSLCIEPMNADARVDRSTVKASVEDVRRTLRERYSAEEIEALKASDPTVAALLAEPAPGEGDSPDPELALLTPEAEAKLLGRIHGLRVRSLGIG